MRGSMDANIVLAAGRGFMSGGGPRPSNTGTDYGSAEQRYTRQSDVVWQDPSPSFVLGLRATFPLLDIQSYLSRAGALTGPWRGAIPMSRTQLGTQITYSQLAKVTS